jgi:hypothetical protein
VRAGKSVGAKLRDDDGLAEGLMQLIQLARQRLPSGIELTGLRVPAIVTVDANHIEDAVPFSYSLLHANHRDWPCRIEAARSVYIWRKNRMPASTAVGTD